MNTQFWHSILAELKPFDGRLAMTWRTAVVCSLAAGVFMVYEVPLVAIGCYLVMFLAKPNAQENVVVAVAISMLVSIVVLLLLGLTSLAIEVPMWRMVIIAVGSYLFVFIGAASALGPGGNIVALVIGFVMTLLPYVPFGELATRGILFAWLMVLIPMGVVIAFHGLAGRSANTQLQKALAQRCRLIAQALEGDNAGNPGQAILEALRAGQGELLDLLKLIRLFHLVPRGQSDAMGRAILGTHDLMIILQDRQTARELATESPDLGTALSDRCRHIAQLLERKELVKAVMLIRTLPVLTSTAGRRANQSGSTAGLEQIMAGYVNGLFDLQDSASQADASMSSNRVKPASSAPASARKSGFFKNDAWTNPEYSRFAIKTTAAAILCYVIYTSIDWQGIHTAMVTCYVAALGSTGETVHKLALRITGCLIGAAMGIAALVFLMPLMTSITQLMLLVFAGVMAAAWVSSGSERISYAGIQIGLAFLMTVLQDFRPDVQLSVATDRIYGILLGNAVLFVMFTRLWPVSVMTTVKRHIAQCAADLRLLATRMTETLSARHAVQPDQQRQLIDTCLKSLNQGREALLYSRFEPHPLRPRTAHVHAIRQELDALETVALRLGRVRAMAAGASGMPDEVQEALQEATRQDLVQLREQIDTIDGARAVGSVPSPTCSKVTSSTSVCSPTDGHAKSPS